MRISSVVIKPIVTEKALALEHESKYFFKVNKNVSKGAVAKEIKRLYDVDVVSVNSMIMPGKKRRIVGTRNFTKTKGWKKVIVELKEGQKINLVGK